MERNFRIMFLDETYVTKRTMPTHAWTPKKKNIQIDTKECQNEVKGIITCISREEGIQLKRVYRHSITGPKFLSFLDELRANNPFTDMMLCMDRLATHFSFATRDRMDELGFLYTYSPAVTP